jgi:hypothetical protein
VAYFAAGLVTNKKSFIKLAPAELDIMKSEKFNRNKILKITKLLRTEKIKKQTFILSSNGTIQITLSWTAV